jgi:uncharacterized protein (TIGR03663 family)
MEEVEYTAQAKVKTGLDLPWLLTCTAVTVVATFLRFVWLGLKPFHHDEGVNGWFLTNLFRDGEYRYDPANYHGPTLYYISLAFSKVFGLETLTVRWSVAIWGVLTVVLAFYLRRYIGRIGALSAGALIALSPGMVYISRYFIHEMFFVFLGLAMVLALLYFIENRPAGPGAIAWMAIVLLTAFFPTTLSSAIWLSGGETASAGWLATFFVIEAVLVFFIIRMILGWRDGMPIYFLLASACVALLFATKETTFITLGTMVIAIGLVWAWRRFYKERPATGGEDEIADAYLNWTNFRSAMGHGIDLWLLLIAGAATFIYLTVLFFSSFFTYPEGVKKAFEAYTIWTETGGRDHTTNGIFAYLRWGTQIEAPIVILSAVGTAIAFLKGRHRFAMFTGLWTLGLFLAYTIIPYKTPWLALSFLLPACIIGGYAIGEIAKMRPPAGRFAATALLLASFAVISYQMYDINFVRYDDEEMPYVYAHTRREFMELVADIDRFAEASGRGRDAAVDVVSPDYWPLVWYVRDYPKAVFHGKLIDRTDAEMIVAKKRDQDKEVIRRFSANYEYVGYYGLRPGVDLILLVRKDIAGSTGQELYRLNQ